MTKLLLHIGYPKTATTSLQENLFLSMHKKGHINYLGRVYFNKNEFNGVDSAIILRKELLSGIQPEVIHLIPNKLNVISDENLTLASIFNECQFDIKSGGLSYPSIIRKVFQNPDEITILLSLRAQTNLLHSLYIQKFKYIFNQNVSIFFEKFIKDANGQFNYDDFKIYDFQNLITSYQKALDEIQFKFLLFEDLKNDNDDYYKELSSIFGMNVLKIKNLLNLKPYRKVTKQGNGIQILKPRFPFLQIEKILGNKFPKYKFSSPTYYQRILNKVIYRKMYTRIEPLQESDRKIIFDNFSAANYTFFKNNNLSMDKGELYGYF